MADETDKKLIVEMVCSDLTECEDFPKGPCVVLCGSVEAVKAAAQHFGETVTLTLPDQSS